MINICAYNNVYIYINADKETVRANSNHNKYPKWREVESDSDDFLFDMKNHQTMTEAL